MSLLFLESRVVKTMVRLWNEGRDETNSSISRQQIANPRPLLVINIRPLPITNQDNIKLTYLRQ